MKARRLAVPVVVVAGLATAAAGAVAASGDTLRASMSGKNEVGATGKGSGTFSGHFNGSRFCYTMRVGGVSNVVAGHIHKGTAKQNGSIVVDLKVAHAGMTQKCVPAKAAARRAIQKSPGAYYVNVHTKSKPAGTMRAQLHK